MLEEERHQGPRLARGEKQAHLCVPRQVRVRMGGTSVSVLLLVALNITKSDATRRESVLKLQFSIQPINSSTMGRRKESSLSGDAEIGQSTTFSWLSGSLAGGQEARQCPAVPTGGPIDAHWSIKLMVGGLARGRGLGFHDGA